jgi:tetratricopeptide (TPR) repeat protein
MAEVLRKTTKVRDFNDDQLKQQENWARMWEAEKEKKRQAFKAAAEKLKNYDYQGSLTAFDETFINAGNVFNGSEAEYTEAVRLRQEAYAKNKQLMELLPFVQRAAEDTQSSLPPEGLQNALKSADQAIALQPTNERTKKYRAAIEAKLAKLTSDNQKSQDLKNRTDGAKQWRTQGETQQKQGKIADAIASYRQSLKFVSDKALEDHVRLLEAEAAKQSEKRAAAEKAWQEGTALFNQGKPSEALTRLKESLSLLPDAQRSQYVKDLEGRQTKARQLRDEGAKLQQQNRVVDAVSRYNESLTYWPDPKLREHITALEAKQKEGQAEESKKARAKQLRDEGYALQQQSRLKEAVAKYRESLSYWPDPQLEKYVKDIEARMAASSGGSTASGPVASTPAKPPTSQPPVQTSSASINIVGAWQTTHHDKGQKVAAGLTHFYKDGTMVIEASKVETAEKGQFIVCRINGSWKMSASTLTVSPGKSECRMPNGTTRTDDFSGDPYSGTVTGDGKSFTAVFGPGMQTTYVRQ